jgi:hypothetical protein
VRLSPHGNLYFTDYHQGLVGALCTDTSSGEPCDVSNSFSASLTNNDPGVSTLRLIAGQENASGNPIIGDSGDGGPAKDSTLAKPLDLVVAAVTAGASYGSGAVGDRFHDHNLIVISGFRRFNQPDTTSSAAKGNVARIICGDPSENGDPGLCRGKQPRTIHKLAGLAGVSKLSGPGNFAVATPFTNLRGATYDGHKNLVLTSSWVKYPPPANDTEFNLYNVENSIYSVSYSTLSQTVGLKYTFTDTNGLSSRYCLRLQVETSCWRGPDENDSRNFSNMCLFRALPASGGESTGGFWESLSGDSAATCF